MTEQTHVTASLDGEDFKLDFGNPGKDPIKIDPGFLKSANVVNVLSTIGLLFIQKDAARVTPESQAIVTLSLYALGGQAELDGYQFSDLKGQVVKYILHHLGDEYADNRKLAAYVLQAAKGRFFRYSRI